MSDRTVTDWLLEQADFLEGGREAVFLREAAATITDLRAQLATAKAKERDLSNACYVVLGTSDGTEIGPAVADLRAQLSTAKADGAREEAERWSSRLMCDSIDSLCPECGSCTWGRPYVDLKPDLSRRVCSQCDAIRPEPATPEEDETP